MGLFWKFLKPVAKCIFVFPFTPSVSTERLQLDRVNSYTSNPLHSSFPLSSALFLLISKSSALLKNTVQNLTHNPFLTVIILKKNCSDKHGEKHLGFLHQIGDEKGGCCWRDSSDSQEWDGSCPVLCLPFSWHLPATLKGHLEIEKDTQKLFNLFLVIQTGLHYITSLEP